MRPHCRACQASLAVRCRAPQGRPRRQAERHQGAAGEDALQRAGHGEAGGWEKRMSGVAAAAGSSHGASVVARGPG